MMLARRPAVLMGRVAHALGRSVALLAVATLMAAQAVAAGPSCDRFAFYLFEQTWLPTFCLHHAWACRGLPGAAGWDVHGLWPEGPTRRQSPEACPGPRFSEAKLGDLARSLESVMNRKIWDHEWRKHGTCALACDGAITSERDYFATVLELARGYDAGAILGRAGIEPSQPDAGRTVATARIAAAIEAATGARAVLRCARPAAGGAAAIENVDVCLGAASHRPIDCPQSVGAGRERCPDRVLYQAAPR